MAMVPPAEKNTPCRKVTAMDIKLALLKHFRFKRQWIAVDECLDADVVADAGNYIVEVEVKVSKQDLLKGEAAKAWKHQNYDLQFYVKRIPNKYYFCVPVSLQKVAVEYAAKLNPKYGVIVFDPEDRFILTVKSAMLLHGGYSKFHSHQIAKRASCKAITMMEKEHKRKGEIDGQEN